jgi:hypothetical protein
MPIILATWEAEIRRTTVPRQPRPKKKKVMRLHGNGKKLGVVAHACHPGDRGRLKVG